MRSARSKPARLLPFIGAAMVLATFVIKDVMSEKLKDRTESLGAAQSFYLSQSANVFIEDDLNYLKQEMDLTKSYVDPSVGADERSDAAIEVRVQANTDHLLSIMQYVQTLSGLSVKLPAETNHAAEVASLYKDVDSAVSQAKRYGQVIHQQLAAIHGSSRDPEILKTNLMNALGEAKWIQLQPGPLESRATAITRSIVSDARANLAASEAWYAKATKASYLLFAAGWMVGLFGQFAGSEGSQKAESP